MHTFIQAEIPSHTRGARAPITCVCPVKALASPGSSPCFGKAVAPPWLAGAHLLQLHGHLCDARQPSCRWIWVADCSRLIRNLDVPTEPRRLPSSKEARVRDNVSV